MTNNLSPEMGRFNERVRLSEFSLKFRNLWGGLKMYMDSHALRRGRERWYSEMTYELLAHNISDIFDNEELEEAVLCDLPMGARFNVMDEKTGNVVFAAIGGYNAHEGVTECFIHSVFAYDPSQWHTAVIFVEKETRGMYMITKDGKLVHNPPQMRFSKPKL